MKKFKKKKKKTQARYLVLVTLCNHLGAKWEK